MGVSMKSWLRSKTLWFNVSAGMLGVVLAALETAPIKPEVLAGVLAVGNIGLRFLTTQAIGSPPSPQA